MLASVQRGRLVALLLLLLTPGLGATADGRRAIGVTELGADGRTAGGSMLRGSDGGAYPQLAAVSARAAAVAYTARTGERQELRLVRVALPEADH